MREVLDAVVIGSGFAGIGMAIKLKESGRHDFVILEKDADLGGTWRDNTYPGCTCDVPSPMYSFSFAQNPDWSRFFSPQPEIWDYLRDVVDSYGLGRHIRYGSEVTAASFDEASGTWDVVVNGARPCAPGLWSPAQAPCTSPTSRTSPASRRSRARRSTPPSGATTTT